MTRPLVLSSRHRPHEIFLLACQTMLGVGYLVTVPPPQSLQALVPAWLVGLWALGLLVSGTIGVVACLVPHTPVAMGLERGALAMSSGALLLIGGCSIVVNGWRAFFAGCIIAAWVSANVVRMLQIRKELKQVHGQ